MFQALSTPQGFFTDHLRPRAPDRTKQLRRATLSAARVGWSNPSSSSPPFCQAPQPFVNCPLLSFRFSFFLLRLFLEFIVQPGSRLGAPHTNQCHGSHHRRPGVGGYPQRPRQPQPATNGRIGREMPGKNVQIHGGHEAGPKTEPPENSAIPPPSRNLFLKNLDADFFFNERIPGEPFCFGSQFALTILEQPVEAGPGRHQQVCRKRHRHAAGVRTQRALCALLHERLFLGVNSLPASNTAERYSARRSRTRWPTGRRSPYRRGSRMPGRSLCQTRPARPTHP